MLINVASICPAITVLHRRGGAAIGHQFKLSPGFPAEQALMHLARLAFDRRINPRAAQRLAFRHGPLKAGRASCA
jgi:hypothetical protein